MENAGSNKILVKNIPETVTRDKLYIHFQRQRNGGGDISALLYPKSKSERSSAVIRFADSDTVKSVLKHDHCIQWTKTQLEVHEMSLDIFDSVKAWATHDCLAVLKQQPWAFGQIEQELSVKTVPGKEGVFQGDLFQIAALDDYLQSLSSDKSSVQSVNSKPHAVAQDRREREFADVHTVRRFADLSPRVDKDNGGDFQSRSSQPVKATGSPENHALGAKGKSHSVHIDKDLISLLKISRQEDIQHIFEWYQVHDMTEGSMSVLTFHETKEGDDPDNGIAQLQSLLDDIDGNVFQKNYDIPKYIGPELIERSMKKVAKAFPTVVVSRNQKEVMFIALLQHDKECLDAKETFITYVEGNKNRSSYASAASRGVSSSYPSQKRDSLFEFTFPFTKLKVLVIKGDIASQDAEAIVNAANNRLHNGGGVTGAIFRAGGYMFEDECRAFMRRRGKDLRVGEVVHTKAYGSLKCQNVIHVTGPMWNTLLYQCFGSVSKAEAKCNEIMDFICSGLIVESNLLQASSIAIPAISTGIYGVRLEIFCNAMIRSITEYQDELKAKRKGCTLREIRLVNFNSSEAAEIASHFKRWGGSKKGNDTAV